MTTLLLLGLLAWQAPTPAPPKAPTVASAPELSSEQKLQIQNVAQKLEIAQLKAQAAQRDFESARVELQALLKTLDKDGYTLDLQTLQYTKKAPPPEAKKN